MGLMIPEWLTENAEKVRTGQPFRLTFCNSSSNRNSPSLNLFLKTDWLCVTGSDELDQVIRVLFGTASFAGGFIGFVLDNLIPGIIILHNIRLLYTHMFGFDIYPSVMFSSDVNHKSFFKWIKNTKEIFKKMEIIFLQTEISNLRTKQNIIHIKQHKWPRTKYLFILYVKPKEFWQGL